MEMSLYTGDIVYIEEIEKKLQDIMRTFANVCKKRKLILNAEEVDSV